MPLGDILKVEGFLKRCSETTRFLQYLMDYIILSEQQWYCNFPNFVCLDLNQSPILLGSRPIPYMWPMTELIQNEMVFQDTQFFPLVVGMNRFENSGQYCFIHDKHFLRALMRHGSNSSLSPSTKSCREGIVNSLKLGS